MAETSKILEGVFAISKPPSLSSAQVIRDLQQHFAKSKTFAPLLADVQRRYEIEDRHQAKRRRRDADSVFKIGHGGTLDPLATGVLIIAIGRGTKHLQNFLGCTKQYDTVVLFGKSTDTYDVMGKIVGEAPFTQITKDKVEEKLGQFRGKIKQVPPVYSALKINGMKAYEYARSGKELPRQLESRDMEVTECRLVEYLEGGQHDFRWPAEEADEDEKTAMKKLMKSADATSQTNNAAQRLTTSTDAAQTEDTTSGDPQSQPADSTTLAGPKQPAPATSAQPAASLVPSEQPGSASEASAKESAEQPRSTADTTLSQKFPSASAEQSKSASQTEPATESTSATAQDTNPQSDPDPKSNTLTPAVKAALHTHSMPTLSSEPSPSPAVRVTLTVSSGFYVRSFAHDLGIKLDSQGLMAELTRSRQADFVIPELASSFPDAIPALTYADFEAGEDKWGPMITETLEKWMAQNPLPGQIDADGNLRPDDRDSGRDRHRYHRKNWGKGRGWSGKGRGGRD